jgi:flagellar biosynthesis protein FlhB
MSGERTERASPRRRQQAAQRGDRVHSRELVAAAAMLCGVLTLGTLAGRWAGQWGGSYQSFLALGGPRSGFLSGARERSGMSSGSTGPAGMSAITPKIMPPVMPTIRPSVMEEGAVESTQAIRQLLLAMLAPLGLMGAAATAGALVSSVAQNGGMTVNAEALQFKFERLNPVQNAKNVFSLRGMARLLKSLLPASVLLAIAVHRIMALSAVPPLSLEQMPGMLRAAYAILLDTAWILFAWSGIDYLIEWRSWEARQRMSKQELREEQKQTEGSPQIRGRIKSLRRQMRRRMLKADVSRASVVITNPAHYAVALSFSFETMEPPKMLAKGRDLIAAQIKEEARWAGVPIVENPPLARSLYRALEPGQSIPYDLYAAVAAILAYLYRQRVEEELRRNAAARAAQTGAAAAAVKTRSTVAKIPEANFGMRSGTKPRPTRDPITDQRREDL